MATIKTLPVGSVGTMETTITEAEVLHFAQATGDFCPLHMNEEFAQTTRFGHRIAHGLLVSNHVSTVMGMTMPGAGTIHMEETAKFLKPTFLGDTITVTVTLVSAVEKTNCYIGTLEGTCVNQRGETVATVSAKQMLPKDFFTVPGATH